MHSTIGIIGAMQSETDLLVCKLANHQIHRTGMQTFHSGSLCGRDVVISMAGIGKVNAAACAAAMILEYGAKTVINTGIAGSLDSDVGIGDTVIASACVEHDLDYGVLGDPRGSVFYPDGSMLVENALDEELAKKLLAAAEGTGLKAKMGIVATGDVFVNDASLRASIHGSFGASACEMEGAAIAHVCRIYGVPCGIVRAISDNANGSSGIDFPTFTKLAADNAAGVIMNFLSNL